MADEQEVTLGEVHRAVLGLRLDLKDYTDKIDKAVFTGNGEPGLLSRTSTLEERSRNTARMVAGLVGAILGFKISGP